MFIILADPRSATMPSGTSFHPTQPFYPKLLPRQQLTFDLVCQDENKFKKIQKLIQPLILTPSTILRVKNVFESELNLALEDSPSSQQSSLHMGNSFLPELPNGTEEGEYLALDLGGTNFRVTWLLLQNGHIVRALSKQFQVPVTIRQSHGSALFDYLADCMYQTMDEYNLHDKRLPLGFSFSFPITLEALDVGTLVKWTKSFKCGGVVGQDAVKLLREALHRRGANNIEVVALLNDMTGVLVKGAYLDSRTAIGVGIGTGTNACYLEKIEKINKWKANGFKDKEIAIITEWGVLGENGVLEFLTTEYDSDADVGSSIKNHTLEKYISGKYLGEVVRCVLRKLVDENLLFENHDVTIFERVNCFPTKFISKIEENDVSHTKEVLEELLLLEIATDDDINIIRHICSLASIRAAQLISACLASLLERVDREYTTVAMDGSVYKCHPKLHSLITYFVTDLVPNKKFQLMLAEDGSGKGAGLVAAIAKRLHNQHLN